jgi:hypothetical protein
VALTIKMDARHSVLGCVYARTGLMQLVAFCFRDLGLSML